MSIPLYCFLGVVLYLVVATPVAFLYTQWLKRVSENYPSVSEWEPRDRGNT